MVLLIYIALYFSAYHQYYYAVIVILVITICLQLVGMCIALALIIIRYPGTKENSPKSAKGSVSPMTVEDNSSNTSDKTRDLDDIPDDCPPYMKRMNSALTVLTIIIAVFHFLRNALDGNYDGKLPPATNSTN